MVNSVITAFGEPEDTGIIANNAETVFGLASLYDKHRWILNEVRKDCGLSVSDVLQMISGERVSIREKYKTAFAVTFDAPGMITGNIFDNWADVRGSLSRRLIIAYFNYHLKTSEVDSQLEVDIIKEVPRIMTKINRGYLAILDFMKTKGEKNLQNIWPKYFDDNVTKFIAKTDPIESFLASEWIMMPSKNPPAPVPAVDGKSVDPPALPFHCPLHVFREVFSAYCVAIAKTRPPKFDESVYISAFRRNSIVCTKEAGWTQPGRVLARNILSLPYPQGSDTIRMKGHYLIGVQIHPSKLPVPELIVQPGAATQTFTWKVHGQEPKQSYNYLDVDTKKMKPEEWAAIDAEEIEEEQRRVASVASDEKGGVEMDFGSDSESGDRRGGRGGLGVDDLMFLNDDERKAMDPDDLVEVEGDTVDATSFEVRVRDLLEVNRLLGPRKHRAANWRDQYREKSFDQRHLEHVKVVTTTWDAMFDTTVQGEVKLKGRPKMVLQSYYTPIMEADEYFKSELVRHRIAKDETRVRICLKWAGTIAPKVKIVQGLMDGFAGGAATRPVVSGGGGGGSQKRNRSNSSKPRRKPTVKKPRAKKD